MVLVVRKTVPLLPRSVHSQVNFAVSTSDIQHSIRCESAMLYKTSIECLTNFQRNNAAHDAPGGRRSDRRVCATSYFPLVFGTPAILAACPAIAAPAAVVNEVGGIIQYFTRQKSLTLNAQQRPHEICCAQALLIYSHVRRFSRISKYMWIQDKYLLTFK